MYKITANGNVIAVFDNVLEAIAYCECFDWVRLEPNGTFSPLEVK